MSQQGLLKEGSSGAANVETITGNSGGAVGPDASFNVNVVGATPISVVGNPGTNTLTIDTDGSLAFTYTADSGSATPVADNINVFGDSAQGSVTSAAGSTLTITNSDATESQKGVLETSSDAESIEGTSSTVSVVPSSLKAKLGSQTQYGIPYGDSDSNAIQWTSVGTDGQLLIAATGASPTFSTLTSSDGSVSFTTGANSLDLSAFSAVSTITITSLDDTDSTYTVLTTDYYMSCDVSGGILRIDLPAAPATGKVFIVKDAGGDCNTNNITVTTAAGVVTIDGATSRVMSTDFEALQFVFNGSSYEVF